jgi:hypothetical protein
MLVHEDAHRIRVARGDCSQQRRLSISGFDQLHTIPLLFVPG